MVTLLFWTLLETKQLPRLFERVAFDFGLHQHELIKCGEQSVFRAGQNPVCRQLPGLKSMQRSQTLQGGVSSAFVHTDAHTHATSNWTKCRKRRRFFQITLITSCRSVADLPASGLNLRAEKSVGFAKVGSTMSPIFTLGAPPSKLLHAENNCLWSLAHSVK